ncbi:sensor histidine kinase [Psychroflexus sediminis]|uniref:Histidine kinase n=1 Tax=Psychroflexus sediminis TaxID=470826 RepID=A0A1G7V8H0_9FLAO|nr:histidine kinase [Psychroflexus sediminis]SDG55639.1 Histidine kinase [Psychroflexus sediminis]
MKTIQLQQFYKLAGISLAIAVLINFINFLSANSIDYLIDYKRFITNFSSALFIGGLNMIFFTLIQKKYSWRKAPFILILLGIPGSMILSVLGFFMARLIQGVLLFGITFQNFIANESLFNYIFVAIISLIVSLAFHTYYFYKFGVESELKVQKEIIEHTKAKHKALQDQLDPHFLFNSLSVLASLIEEDPKRATEFTTSLSKVYRYVLDQRQEDLVSISSELDFARVYLNLLSTRFEDSLEYSIEVPDESYDTVPLSLQLLIENAVKHNKVTEKSPLIIQIYQTKEHFVIQNNANPKANDSKRNGIGLMNIRKRFERYTESPIEIEKDSDTFRVKLPLIQTQNL